MKSQTKQILIAVVISVLVGLTFVPMFPDPYHEKTEPVIFWEWLYKEVAELIGGEYPA